MKNIQPFSVKFWANKTTRFLFFCLPLISILIFSSTAKAQKYKPSQDVISALKDDFYLAHKRAYNFDEVLVLDKDKNVTASIEFKNKIFTDVLHTEQGTFAIRAFNKGNSSEACWAYFTKEGKQLTDFICKKPNPFINGKAAFFTNTGCGIIKNTGEIIVQPIYSSIQVCSDIDYFIASKTTVITTSNEIKNSTRNINIYNYNNQPLLPLQLEHILYLGKGFFEYATSMWSKSVGLIGPDFKVLTKEVFPKDAFQKIIATDTIPLVFNGKKFIIGFNGKPMPDNGTLEYEVGKKSAEELKMYSFNIDSTYWQTANFYYAAAIQKGNALAKASFDSISKTSKYINAHPSLRFLRDEKYINSIMPFAKQGDVKSIQSVVQAYLDGSGLQKDTTKALEWLQQLVKKNNIAAFEQVAKLYVHLLQPQKALQFLQTSKIPDSAKNAKFLYNSLQNTGGIEHNLALVYDQKKDSINAVLYYEKAVAAKNKDAILDYGKFLLKHKNASKAINIIEANAINNHIPSMYYLASYYSNSEDKATFNVFRSNMFLKMVVDSPDATENEKAIAKNMQQNNVYNAGDKFKVGTVFSYGGVKKIVKIRQNGGFYANDGNYYSETGYGGNQITILRGESDVPFRKTCYYCAGNGTTVKSVKDGSYTTTDVRYKTGSTISGDKKITTTTTHNTYKGVSEQCIICTGKGYTY